MANVRLALFDIKSANIPQDLRVYLRRIETIVAQWHKRMNLNAMGLGSNPIRRNELIKFFIASLW